MFLCVPHTCLQDSSHHLRRIQYPASNAQLQSEMVGTNLLERSNKKCSKKIGGPSKNRPQLARSLSPPLNGGKNKCGQFTRGKLSGFQSERLRLLRQSIQIFPHWGHGNLLFFGSFLRSSIRTTAWNAVMNVTIQIFTESHTAFDIPCVSCSFDNPEFAKRDASLESSRAGALSLPNQRWHLPTARGKMMKVPAAVRSPNWDQNDL